MALPSLALFLSAGLALFLLPFMTRAERVRYDDEDLAEVLSPEEDRPLQSKELLPGDALLEQYRVERLRRLAGTPLVPWPANLNQNYQSPLHLGAGTFGESWLVTDADPESSMYGKKVVVKLLYVKDGGNGYPAHLTWSSVQYDMQLKKSTMEAARECDIASFLHDEAEKRQARGAQRVMNCFGHNIPASGEQVSYSALNAPLYLVLENCGADDLTKFMHKKAQANQLSVELIGNLFKQILEGLDFLSTLPVPWIHHDLKPDNIVVKTQDDGTYTVHLIDFGATTRATKEYVCDFTPSTPIFAPQEWGSYTLECPSNNFDYDPYCKTCPTAFDMFSAGAILLQMVTGSWVSDLPNAWNRHTSRFNWHILDAYVANMASLRSSTPASAHDVLTVSPYYNLMVSFWQLGSQSLAFFDKVMLTLSTPASDRPTAGALLSKEAFMLSISTPDDRETGTPGMGLQPQVLAFSCPYEKEEEVEVFSRSAGGYVYAKVTDVDSNGMVHVAYGNRVNELACKSALIRKKASQHNQALQNLIANGFKPASGGQQRNFRVVVYENQPPSCPGICSMCETAQTTNGAKAVYCWSMLVRSEQELGMYGCAKKYSATGVIGGRYHWKYLCVGR